MGKIDEYMVPLMLKFKGDRDYIHGTDIYNGVLDCLKAINEEPLDIDFSFHKIARHQLEVYFNGHPGGGKPVARCSYISQGIRRIVSIAESTNTVVERYFSDEESYVAGLELCTAEKKCTLFTPSQGSDIEVWVAMTKVLHNQIYRNNIGKWFFVRAKFSNYKKKTEYSQRIVVNLAAIGNKLTRSKLIQDGDDVGEIYFSYL